MYGWYLGLWSLPYRFYAYRPLPYFGFRRGFARFGRGRGRGWRRFWW